MRKLVITAATAALAIGMAAPAVAQDSDKAPFTGVRVEALAGYDHLSDGDSNSSGKDGFAYGGAIGYDAQVGGVVLGVDGEIDGSTTKVRGSNVLTAGDRLRVSAGRDLYVGGRLGYVVSPRTMIYAKGGYTNARINTDYTVGTARIEDHTDLDGYRVGAGVEYNVTPKAYVKAEYRYSHYGNAGGYDIDADRNQVLAGVGYRF
ncbi:MAG: outer membrane beta-barrel protein [Pseudomonadota bacterium]